MFVVAAVAAQNAGGDEKEDGQADAFVCPDRLIPGVAIPCVVVLVP